MKVCTKCNNTFVIKEFYQDKKSKDGYSYWCNRCIKLNVKRLREDPEYRKKQQEWNDKWRKRPENRETVLAIRRKSQNTIYNTLRKVGIVTNEIRQRIYKRDNESCLACNLTRHLTIDHIVPVSKGGITTDENLQTLCNSCNSKKHNKIISYR